MGDRTCGTPSTALVLGTRNKDGKIDDDECLVITKCESQCDVMMSVNTYVHEALLVAPS